MIEKDPNFLEAELLGTLKTEGISSLYWTALENQKFLEAYELCGCDCAISQHVGTKSTEQVFTKRQQLLSDMKNQPGMPMSHLLHTDPKVNRQKVKWTESEEQKFNDAVRKVGNKPYQISNIVGTKTFRQVNSHISKMRHLFKKDPASPNADVAQILIA